MHHRSGRRRLICLSHLGDFLYALSDDYMKMRFYAMGKSYRRHPIVAAVATLGDAVSLRLFIETFIGFQCQFQSQFEFQFEFHHGQFMSRSPLLCSPSSGSCFLFKLLWHSFSFSFCPISSQQKDIRNKGIYPKTGENLFTE